MRGMAAPLLVAKITKRFNPYALRFSSRVPPWATVHHVGRRSGARYQTPVVAFAGRADDDSPVQVVTPLPWGSGTDWARNVLAAGSYRLTRARVDYQVDQVRVIGAEEAARLLRGAPRAMTSRGVTEFLAGRPSRVPMG